MALPSSAEARIFYQAALRRFEDAEFLLDGERTTGAVYLAGYAVECMLKAMILSRTREKEQADVAASFRGVKAHDFGWLMKEYLARKGPQIPKAISRLFYLVNTWTTSIRYRPGAVRKREAIAFVRAAKDILSWSDGKL